MDSVLIGAEYTHVLIIDELRRLSALKLSLILTAYAFNTQDGCRPAGKSVFHETARISRLAP